MIRAFPESLCPLPWLHSHVNAQGQRGLCCIDPGTYENSNRGQSFEEFWNSDEMKLVRRQMMSGVRPERCRRCAPAENNRGRTYQADSLSVLGSALPQALASTLADGTTSALPVSFDHRTSLCNFKCRTCGPHSSTAAESEQKREPRLREISETIVSSTEERNRARAFSLDEILRANDEKRIRRLYWAGGEPMLDPNHWRVMQELVDTGRAERVDVSYNTNLSIMENGDRRLEDFFGSFRRIEILVSCDGIGEVGEYIRTGFDQRRFETNLDRLLTAARRHRNVAVRLDATLTSLNLLHLGDLIRFALERRVGITAKTMFPDPTNSYLAVEFLPRQVKDDLCSRWIALIDSHVPWYRRRFTTTMNRIFAPSAPDFARLRSCLVNTRDKQCFSETMSESEWSDLQAKQKRVVDALESIRPSRLRFSETLESGLDLRLR